MAPPSYRTSSRKKKQKKRKKKKKYLEQKIQESFKKYLDKNHQNVFYCASFAGAVTSKIQAGIAIRRGYVPGFPDFAIYLPNKNFHGLFVEFKSPNGAIDKKQNQILARLRKAGYCTAICRSLSSAIRVFLDYVHNTNNAHYEDHEIICID